MQHLQRRGARLVRQASLLRLVGGEDQAAGVRETMGGSWVVARAARKLAESDCNDRPGIYRDARTTRGTIFPLRYGFLGHLVLNSQNQNPNST